MCAARENLNKFRFVKIKLKPSNHKQNLTQNQKQINVNSLKVKYKNLAYNINRLQHNMWYK